MKNGTKKRPNLMIIGAAKSGTNSLHQYLNLHPQVWMIPEKETSFFTNRKLPGQLYAKDLSSYLKFYERAPDSASVLGESSVSLTAAPHIDGVPERLFAFNPQMRFIYVMRNPVARTISHYQMLIRQGLEHRRLRDAVLGDSALRNVSHYAMQLDRYFPLFPRSQFFITTTETLRHERAATVNAIFEWLELDTLPKNVIESEPEYYVGQEQNLEFWLTRLIKHQNVLPAVKTIVPATVREFIKQRLLPKAKPLSEDIDQQELSEVQGELRKICATYQEELELLLKRRFPEWG